MFYIAIVVIIGIALFAIAQVLTDGQKCIGNITKCNIQLPHVPSGNAFVMTLNTNDPNTQILIVVCVVCIVGGLLILLLTRKRATNRVITINDISHGYMPCQNDTLTSEQIAEHQRELIDTFANNRRYTFRQ